MCIDIPRDTAALHISLKSPIVFCSEKKKLCRLKGSCVDAKTLSVHTSREVTASVEQVLVDSLQAALATTMATTSRCCGADWFVTTLNSVQSEQSRAVYAALNVSFRPREFWNVLGAWPWSRSRFWWTRCRRGEAGRGGDAQRVWVAVQHQ